MTRIITADTEDNKPRISRASVQSFFEQRAVKAETLGNVRAVIYQDKHPDLAEQRDYAEKARMLPLIVTDGSQRLLDIGCGTGRWAESLIQHCSYYHGLDFSPGLVARARATFQENEHIRFSVGSADSYSLQSLGISSPFNCILCSGVLIYLNDDEMANALQCIESVSGRQTRVIFREPMALEQRLTISEHFSDEMEQEYNAIYRTQSEIEEAIASVLGKTGFQILNSGDVYLDEALNNRAETRQRWIILERK